MSASASIYSEKDKLEIRKALKKSFSSNSTKSNQVKGNKYRPETHHVRSVPYEGSVYSSAACSLNTKDIDQKYKQSLTPIWWIVIQSIFSFLKKKVVPSINFY